MAVTKIHAIKATTSKALLYIENPAKTEGQLLVSAYNTEPQSAAIDFEITATAAHKARSAAPRYGNNLAYHLIQSFSPDDDLTPEQAHEIGRKLAQEFTGGRFEFVLATHVDKGHLHNHIIINAVSFYDYKKLLTVPYRTARQIRGISDRLCAEAELSVIESPEQLGRQYSDYIKKRKQTPVRTEVRRRLNFCLDRADSYAQFKHMALELGIQINDSGKYVSYRYEGAGKAIRDNKLADTDKYTVNGIRERVEDNCATQEQLRTAIQALLPQASSLAELHEKLKQAGIQTKINRRSGAVCYLVNESDEDWIPEDAFGCAFLSTNLEKCISEKHPLIATAENVPLLERYHATVRMRPCTPDTLVALTAKQVQKTTRDGLIVKTQDCNGHAVALMVPKEQVEAAPDGCVQIAIGSLFEYDITYADGTHGSMHGSELIRQIELNNGVKPIRVELSAEQIKSMSLKGVTVTLPQAGVERAFIPNEYVRRDKLAATCAVLLYPNWDYSFVPVGDDKTRQTRKGADLAAALRSAIPMAGTGDDGSLRRRIAYAERKAQIANAKVLAHTLQQMKQGGYQTAADFSPRLHDLQKEQQTIHTQIAELTQKNQQYAVAARNLQTCQTYGAIQEEYLQKSAFSKRAFYTKHRQALDAFQAAASQLENIGVHQTVEPEKVRNLIKTTEQQIRQLQNHAELLHRQEAELLLQQVSVQEIQEKRGIQHDENTV